MAFRNLYRISFPTQIYTNSIRSYARWMNRNPGKVLLPFEPNNKVGLKKEKVIELTDEKFENHGKQSASRTPKLEKISNSADKIVEKIGVSTLSKEKSEDVKKKKDEKMKRRKLYLSQLKVFDDSNSIIYEKVKENDSQVSSILVKLKSRKERVRSGLTLVEGWRLIVDGLEAKCKLKYIMFSQTEDLNKLRPFLPKTGVKIYKMPYKEIELWSDTETPQGVFGIFETPTPDNVKILSRPLPLQFICDNVRVPGNLGAILRVAVGAGCEKVLLTKGCVDVWDPKVIRSAAGAHFRLPIYNSKDWDEIPLLLEKDTSILIADNNVGVIGDEEYDNFNNNQSPVLPYYAIDYHSYNHMTLIIGGETEGISQQSYEFAVSRNGVRVNIPLQKGVDSLNTGMATAVIAFEIKKQLLQAWNKAKLERQMVHP